MTLPKILLGGHIFGPTASQPITKVFAKAGLYNVIFIISNVAALVRADIYKFGF